MTSPRTSALIAIVIASCGRREAAHENDAAPVAAGREALVDASASAPAAVVSAAPSATSSAAVAPSASAVRPKPMTASYLVGRSGICVPDGWTQGVTAYAGPPRCGATLGRQVWGGDVERPCGPCAFTFDAATTRYARRSHPDACCFHGASPHGP